MMTNYEFYKEKITTILASGNNLAVRHNTPTSCEQCYCLDCDLRGGSTCSDGRIKWLNAKYIEPVALTKKERAFLESLSGDFHYVVKATFGHLQLYQHKPEKVESCDPFGFEREEWGLAGEGGKFHRIYKQDNPFNIKFDFIKSTDKEPWSIEELLKLEVIDDE